MAKIEKKKVFVMAKTESGPQIAFFKKVSRLEKKNHFMKVEQKKVLQTEAI